MLFKIFGTYNAQQTLHVSSRNNILFNKQFVFRADHSTEHALLELIDQISDSLNNKSYFLRIFINLSKAFDSVDHKILLKKLQHYGIKGKNLP